MTILAAINFVLKLFRALIDAGMDKEGHLARVNELLTQLKTLGDEDLGRMLQRMNYVRELFTRSVLPPLDDFKAFLNQIIQIIDCDAKPYIPDGWKVVEHQKGGKMEWDPTKIQLYLSDSQKDGKYIEGNKLRKELKNKPVLNACVLDWLLAHPEFIPEEWKEEYVFFWGTIYRRSDGALRVRYLCWDDGGWRWRYGPLVSDWDSGSPAAVLAS
jgi:hypothetical protein